MHGWRHAGGTRHRHRQYRRPPARSVWSRTRRAWGPTHRLARGAEDGRGTRAQTVRGADRCRCRERDSRRLPQPALLWPTLRQTDSVPGRTRRIPVAASLQSLAARALVDPTFTPRERGAVSTTPVQTVRADFPHTAYQGALGVRHYAASGYRIVPRRRWRPRA